MICTRCNGDKETRSFHIATRRKDGTPIYRKYCNECYKKVKDIRNVALTKQFNDYKESLSCKDCGMSFKNRPWICDFHHINAEDKITEVAKMRLSRPAWIKLKSEIDKCEPLCANCHRGRHHGNIV